MTSERYARNDAAASYVGLGACAVRPCLGGGRLLAPAAAVEAVSRLEGCKTLAEHESTLAGGRGFESGRAREALAAAVEHRLLISERALAEAFRASGGQPPRGIGALVVLTRDRPALLRRCVESYARNLAEHGRRISIVVFDDSGQEPALAESAATCQAAAARFGLRVDHFGRAAARALADDLQARTGAARELIDLALFGPTGGGHLLGANRNRMLLHTAGQGVIAVDDDTVCELHTAGGGGGWALESRDEEETWFFADRASARATWPMVPLDFVGLFEPVLGREVAAVLADGAFTARTLRPATLGSALRPGAAVRYASPGLVGDCAGRAPYLLSTTGDARERLMADAPYYALAAGTREVARCVRRRTLSAPSWCMGYALGLDNAGLLPPFLPAFRNSDGLFGRTLAACDPRAFRADLPCALFHDPAEARSFAGVDHAEAWSRYGVAEVVATAVHLGTPAPVESDPARRLQAIGAFLERLGGGPPADFQAAITDSLRQKWAVMAAHLDRLRLEDRGPGHFRRDAERAVRGLHAAIRGDGPLAPSDLPGAPAAGRLLELQGLVQGFGRLLVLWPDLRRAALERGGR